MAAFIILLTLFSSAFATETCLDPTQGMRTIEGIAMLKGPLKGQCIATNEARPAELLVQDNNLLTINAVSHEAKFVVAQVDLTDIKDAVFQLEKFPPEWIAAHTQLRIRFKSPSVLLAKK